MGRQLLFQACEGFPQQVTVAGGIYAGIVSRGFDPQNVGNGSKENPLLVLYHKAFQLAETTEDWSGGSRPDLHIFTFRKIRQHNAAREALS